MPIQVVCESCQGKFNAPDTAAGKRAKCPTCGSAIQIPTPAPAEEILDAVALPASPYSDDDFEVEAPAALPATPDTKPCPMCGEAIQRSALKCRHCGEIFDPMLKAQQSKTAGYSGDDDLSIGDWLLCIVCSGIGCILSIIYIIQGKPKGTKMLLISICAQAFWALVSFLSSAAQQ